jgi:cyclohexanone monooxygenase
MSGFKIGIIGAGPGGLALGILLSRASFRDFTIFDREDDVGGTWRINTYPGLACDVKSHLYSYSFELNPDWSRLWSAQPEILAYFQRCADKYGLRRRHPGRVPGAGSGRRDTAAGSLPVAAPACAG